MFDWNWLWVVGELGVACGFYYWLRSEQQFLAALEGASDIDIDKLKEISTSNKSVDYAVVHGIVRGADSKSSPSVNSQFVSGTAGVIQRFIIREKKFEKLSKTWVERSKLIQDATRWVAFKLASPVRNYILIDEPLKFDLIKNNLEVTHFKFEPNTSSSVDKIVDTLLGEVSQGIETEESMLLFGSSLTGIGRLEQRSDGIWHLVPHKKWGGILTRMSRAEITSDHEGNSTLAKVMGIIFALVALGTGAYLICKNRDQSARRPNRDQNSRRPNRLPAVPPVDTNRTVTHNTDTRMPCVICLDNEVVYSLQPCSHLGLCHTCAQALQTNNTQSCPICRAPIQEYQRVFLP